MQKSQAGEWVSRWGDWAVAGVIILVGLALTLTAYSYSLGTVQRIGPGMMPFLIGICLMIAPIFVMLRSKHEQIELVAVPYLRVACLLGGVLAWGLTIDRFGLVPATVILMTLATLAYGPIRWLSTGIVIAATTLGCVLLFIYGFRLPFDIVRWG